MPKLPLVCNSLSRLICTACRLLCKVGAGPAEPVSSGVCLQALKEVGHAQRSTSLLNGACANQHPTPAGEPRTNGGAANRPPAQGLKWHRTACPSPMENAIAVHVVHRLEQLPHVALGALLRHIVAAPPNQLVDVHVHQLKHEGQAPRRLITAPEKAGDCAELCGAYAYQLSNRGQAACWWVTAVRRSRSWCRTEPLPHCVSWLAEECWTCGRYSVSCANVQSWSCSAGIV